jgi:hypothetical protein
VLKGIILINSMSIPEVFYRKLLPKDIAVTLTVGGVDGKVIGDIV